MVRIIKYGDVRKIVCYSIEKVRYNTGSGIGCAPTPGEEVHHVFSWSRVGGNSLAQSTAGVLASVSTKIQVAEIISSQHLDMWSSSDHVLCGQDTGEDRVWSS